MAEDKQEKSNVVGPTSKAATKPEEEGIKPNSDVARKKPSNVIGPKVPAIEKSPEVEEELHTAIASQLDFAKSVELNQFPIPVQLQSATSLPPVETKPVQKGKKVKRSYWRRVLASAPVSSLSMFLLVHLFIFIFVLTIKLAT